MDLTLETKGQANKTATIGPAMLTPPIDEDYWAYRVKVSEAQAIVGFPKFGTVGVGFAQEEDWNSNLPYTCDAEKIYNHIAHNKGDDAISREDCIAAIRMIQGAVTAERIPHVTIRLVPTDELQNGEEMPDGRPPMEIVEHCPGRSPYIHGTERGIAPHELRDRARAVADRLGIDYIDPISPDVMGLLASAEAV